MKITLVGNKTGVYIDPVDNNAYIDYTKSENYADVNFAGVNNIVVTRFVKAYRGEVLRIVQAGGYTADRGLFVDCY